MKYLIPIIIFIQCFTYYCDAQPNHVINGNFDVVSTCPVNLSQANRCSGWRSYSNGTPDYFNSCASSGMVDVPLNFVGFQYAASGNGYMGGYYYTAGINNSYKEYIAGKMTPLTPGKSYEVSLSVSLANTSHYGTNDLGIFFYDSGANSINTQNVIPFTPQVSYSSYGPIMDTSSWVRLSKIFVADSAYDNIVIGGFMNYNSLTTNSLGSNGNDAYYYIDSVVVRQVDTIRTTAFTDTILCVGDTFRVPFATLVKYYSSNVFKIQLSDKSGSFNDPVIIGSVSADSSDTVTCVVPSGISTGDSFKVRLIATSPADTSAESDVTLHIGNPDSITHNLTNNGPVCEGATVLFYGTVSLSPFRFHWTGPNNFVSTTQNPYIAQASVADNGVFHASIKVYGCILHDTTKLVVYDKPAKPVTFSNAPFCSGDTLKLGSTCSTSGVTFKWKGPQSYNATVSSPAIPHATTSMSGNYMLTVSKNGCYNRDTTWVNIKPWPDTPSISTNSPLCSGDSLQLQASPGTTGAVYSWSGPNSYSSNILNTGKGNAQVSATGWYKLLVNLNGCTYNDSVLVHVYSVPATPVLTYDSVYCAGELMVINAGVGSGAICVWDGPANFKDTTIQVLRSNIHQADSGIYRVRAIRNNCVSPEDSARIYINPTPFSVIYASPGDTVCKGSPAVFTALPNNIGANPQFAWKINAQYVGSGTTFTTSGLMDGDVVRCDMTDHEKCSMPHTDQSNEIKMTVLPLLTPKVTISATPTHPLQKNEYITFTAHVTDAGAAPQYQWKRNGKSEIGARGKTWSANTLNDNDSVYVEVTSSYACPQPAMVTSNGVVVKVLTSVSGEYIANDLVLYPNPNSGRFILKGKVKTDAVLNMEVINAVGQVIYSGKTKPVNGNLYREIDMNNLASGVYLLRLSNKQGVTGVLRFEIH